jgi:hypothetical protein
LKILALVILVGALFVGASFDIGVAAVTLDDLSVTVAYLKEGDKIGTGFFVSSAQPYLVTASHVASLLKPESNVTFRAAGDVPISLTLRDLAPGNTNLPWHVSSDADVSVLPLKLSDKTIPLMQGRFLKIGSLSAEEIAPRREQTVIVMGFPLALGTTGRFSPITSDAKPASGLLRIPRFDTKKEAIFFLLDKPSIGGFSGAPVYLSPGPFSSGGALVFQNASAPPSVVGLVHGTISDNTGGKLAAIVPAKFIRDTILEADQHASATSR